MILAFYRKRRDGPEWHFHTKCSRWPETDFVQTRVPPRGEPLCDECGKLEAAMLLMKD
jgi:hypothetical protein